jgi:hypothetical protein
MKQLPSSDRLKAMSNYDIFTRVFHKGKKPTGGYYPTAEEAA